MQLELTSYDYSPIWQHVIAPWAYRLGYLLILSAVISLAWLTYAMMKYRLNPFRLSIGKLEKCPMRFKPFSFLRWVIVDRSRSKSQGLDFDQFGLTAYCGRQGAGKTISMIHYLNRMHKRFPNALIVTNFSYKYATHRMKDWRDFFEVRNGIDGVIFAIDEIHSEYSSAAWKDFPEDLLSEISQQRKQRVKIVCTSQVFSRIAKPIREQCFSVVQCKTFAGRWTFNREYDAYDYEQFATSAAKDTKLKTIWKSSFVQSDLLRLCYDTYEKIEKLGKSEFIPRSER